MLQADPYALRYAASRFSAGAQEFRSQASQLLRRKTELVSYSWKGSASQSFDMQVEHQITCLKKNSNVLEQAASVLNQLATRMEQVLELRRQAEQYEMASWEYSGDSLDDLRHTQNLRRQADHYRKQAEWEAQQADSMATVQLQQIMSMIPDVMNLVGQGSGSAGDLDDLPEPIRSYYRRHPELVEDASTSEVAASISWASVKRTDETAIQQDVEIKSRMLALLKDLTKQERMGYWDQSTDQEVFDQDYGEMSTDELKAQVFARLLKNQAPPDIDEIAAINASISTGVDFIPIVGNLKSAVEAITGKDYITSHDLSWLERGFALAGLFVGGLGKAAGKVVKGSSKEVADQVAKNATFHTIENVAEGTGKAVTKLGPDELVVADKSFLNAEGRIDWERHAPNGGYVQGTRVDGASLDVGTVIDRYGTPRGSYTSPVGTSYGDRALPYIENSNAYHQYMVVKPIDDVSKGEIAPAFNQPGGGIQYELPNSIEYLLNNGFLEEIKR